MLQADITLSHSFYKVGETFQYVCYLQFLKHLNACTKFILGGGNVHVA
jgi:hypothetical protein